MLPTEVIEALKVSFLKSVDPRELEPALRGGMTIDVQPRVFAETTQDPLKIAIVLEGLYRQSYQDMNGKIVTVRYIGPGEFMGIPAMVGGPVALDLASLSAGRLFVFEAGHLQKLAQENPEVSWLIAEELCSKLYSTLSDLIFVQCRSVKERLSLHLRVIAEKLNQGSTDVLIPLRQQDLAESIGSSREVVARALKALREDGVLDAGGEKIIIKDLARLPVDWTDISEDV